MERKSFRRTLRAISSIVFASSTFLAARSAEADVTLLKTDNGEGWEFYTSGRVNAFFSWAKGDNMPVAPNGAGGPLYQFKSAGGTGTGDTDGTADVIYNAAGAPIGHTQGTVDSMRVRSGFVGNVIGFGLRRNLDPQTKVTAFISTWAVVESVGRRKYTPAYADVREGYLKIEGPWGSVLAGRALTLFNRGTTEANFLYLHGYGLGYPGSISIQGPAAGLIGFGVLASTFSAGLVYASPQLAGVQLSAGIYDPASLVGSRLERTGAVRPEFELTVDEPISNLGKVHLYVNGTIQKLYVKQESDAFSETAKGVGAGGRIELGPVHLAAGLHRGIGLGLTFALEPSESTYNGLSQLRDSSGFFAMGQLSLSKFDINAGFGQTKVEPLEIDNVVDPLTGYPTYSLIKTQTGIAGAVVFHATNWLHFDLDVMHADFKWTLNDRQKINFYNAGTTVTW